MRDFLGGCWPLSLLLLAGESLDMEQLELLADERLLVGQAHEGLLLAFRKHFVIFLRLYPVLGDFLDPSPLIHVRLHFLIGVVRLRLRADWRHWNREFG